MRRSISNPFTGGGGPNGQWLFDYVPGTPAAFQSVRTAGATMFQPITNVASSGTAKPKLLSVSAHATLTFVMSTPAYGKLGRVVMGLVLDTPPPGTWGNPLVMAPFPNDQTLMADMWNPVIDAMPPVTPNAVTNLQPTTFNITGQISVPISLDVRQEQEITLGIWITPSLLAPLVALPLNTVMGLLLGNTSYSLNYDDGLE